MANDLLLEDKATEVVWLSVLLSFCLLVCHSGCLFFVCLSFVYLFLVCMSVSSFDFTSVSLCACILLFPLGLSLYVCLLCACICLSICIRAEYVCVDFYVCILVCVGVNVSL